MPPSGPSGEQAQPSRPLVEPLPFLIVAGVGVTAIVFVLISTFRSLPIPAIVSEDFTRVAGAVLGAEIRESDPELLSSILVARQPAVAARVPDLRPRGFALVGGSVREVDGQPGVLAIYRDGLQELLVWQAYLGRLRDLPGTGDVRDHEGRRYVVHRKASHILVFWQDGPNVQVLTGSLPAEQVVTVAYAIEGRP